MRLHLHELSRLTACILFAATPAIAGNFYVDAVNGNDANGGTAALDAWRTLTHAVTTIPAQLVAHTIHVAPGIYSAASGEVFPIAMRPKMRLIGDQGSAVTILEGPAPLLVSFISNVNNNYDFDGQSGAQGLTLRNADRGMSIVASGFTSVSPSFHDLTFAGLSSGVEALGGGMYGGVNASTFDRVTIADCGQGMLLSFSGTPTTPNSSSVHITDSTIRGCTTDGIAASTRVNETGVLWLTRCRLIDNGGSGVLGKAQIGYPTMPSHLTIVAENTLFAGNLDAGIRLFAEPQQLVSLDAKHCTLAHNARAGAVLNAPFSNGEASALVWNSVLCGNGHDLISPIVGAYYSNAADGALLGYDGCIAADARFVNPASGDYRLAFGSPCIDSADPAFATPIDLLGQVRSFDGDLDTVAIPDMGAMEFAPLCSTGSKPGSTRLTLEISGPDYGRSILYLSDAPLLMTPETTPFGSFFLVRSTAVVLPTARIQSRTSNLLELKIPALAVPGSTVSIQALIRSQAAPAGAAWSNPLEFVVAP